jgi:pimeloyl-ACP methyl ester carboxylesterase
VSDVLQLPLVGRPLARLAIARMRRDPERRRQAYLSTLAHPERAADDPGLAALLEVASERLVAADLRAMADWAASGMAFDVRPLAPRMAQPTLVVAGDRDRVTPVEGALRLVSVLPGARMLRLRDVAHFPHLEAPGAVLPALVEHLG